MNATIKEWRKKRKITQVELAEYMGVSQAMISKWERGDTYPRLDDVEKMRKIFKLRKIDHIVVAND